MLLVFETRFEECDAILRGIAHHEHGHGLWQASLDDEARAVADPVWLAQGNWDGVISRHTTSAMAEQCRALGIPFVDLNDCEQFPGMPKVRPDKRAIGHAGAEEFIARGHRHPGFAGCSDVAWSVERRDGFLEAALLAGVSANAGQVEARRIDRGGALAQWIQDRAKAYTGPAGGIRLWWSGSTYRVRHMFGEIQAQYNLLVAKKDTQADEIRPWRFNVVTNYYFSEGRFKGVNAGGGYRWQDKAIIGYQLTAPATGQSASDVTAYDINQPVHGPSEDAIDLWTGYDRQLTKKLKWHVQLNLGNAFEETRLVPIATQPDGSIAHYRIAEGMNWTLTNRLEF